MRRNIAQRGMFFGAWTAPALLVSLALGGCTGDDAATPTATTTGGATAAATPAAGAIAPALEPGGAAASAPAAPSPAVPAADIEAHAARLLAAARAIIVLEGEVRTLTTRYEAAGPAQKAPVGVELGQNKRRLAEQTQTLNEAAQALQPAYPGKSAAEVIELIIDRDPDFARQWKTRTP